MYFSYKYLEAISKLILLICCYKSTIVFSQSYNLGLIAHYKFTGNTNDATNNALHLTNTGAVLTTDRFGQPNSAYFFNGASIMLRTAVNGTLFSNSFITTSAWLKPVQISQAGGDSRIIAIGKLNTHWQFITHAISRYTNTGLWIGSDGIGSYNFIATTTAIATPGKWLHMTCVADLVQDTVSIYFNGQLEIKYKAGINTLYLTDPVQNIMIGSSHNAPQDEFYGSIDEAKIFNRALSKQEIADMYANDTSLVSNGISEIDLLQKESLFYPNPAENLLGIRADSQLLWVAVYSVTGEEVISVNDLQKNSIATIDLQTLPAGVYVVKGSSHTRSYVEKIVLRR